MDQKIKIVLSLQSLCRSQLKANRSRILLEERVRDKAEVKDFGWLLDYIYKMDHNIYVKIF